MSLTSLVSSSLSLICRSTALSRLTRNSDKGTLPLSEAEEKSARARKAIFLIDLPERPLHLSATLQSCRLDLVAPPGVSWSPASWSCEKRAAS